MCCLFDARLINIGVMVDYMLLSCWRNKLSEHLFELVWDDWFFVILRDFRIGLVAFAFAILRGALLRLYDRLRLFECDWVRIEQVVVGSLSIVQYHFRSIVIQNLLRLLLQPLLQQLPHLIVFVGFLSHKQQMLCERIFLLHHFLMHTLHFLLKLLFNLCQYTLRV